MSTRISLVTLAVAVLVACGAAPAGTIDSTRALFAIRPS